MSGPLLNAAHDPAGSRAAGERRPTEPAAPGGLAAALAGDWRVERWIRDAHPPGLRARFVGAASLRPDPADPAQVRHDESGRLRLPGGEVVATRRYLWRLEGAVASLRYADGAPLVDFDIAFAPGARRRARGRHLCGPDLYEAAMRLVEDRVDRGDGEGAALRAWVLVWRIEGPRKRIRIATRYERMRAAE